MELFFFCSAEDISARAFEGAAEFCSRRLRLRPPYRNAFTFSNGHSVGVAVNACRMYPAPVPLEK